MFAKRIQTFLGRVLSLCISTLHQQNTQRTLPRNLTKPQLHYLMVRLQYYLTISL